MAEGEALYSVIDASCNCSSHAAAASSNRGKREGRRPIHTRGKIMWPLAPSLCRVAVSLKELAAVDTWASEAPWRNESSASLTVHASKVLKSET